MLDTRTKFLKERWVRTKRHPDFTICVLFSMGGGGGITRRFENENTEKQRPLISVSHGESPIVLKEGKTCGGMRCRMIQDRLSQSCANISTIRRETLGSFRLNTSSYSE